MVAFSGCTNDTTIGCSSPPAPHTILLIEFVNHRGMVLYKLPLCNIYLVVNDCGKIFIRSESKLNDLKEVIEGKINSIKNLDAEGDGLSYELKAINNWNKTDNELNIEYLKQTPS